MRQPCRKKVINRGKDDKMRKIGAKVPSFSHYAQSFEQLLCKQRAKLCKQRGKKRRNFFKKLFTKRNFSYIMNRHILEKTKYAAIAQSVECILGKDEVTSSNLVSSSKRKSVHESGRIFVCIIHYSFFIIHYSLTGNGFSNE